MIEHNSKDDFSLIYSLVRCFAKSGSVQLFGGRSRASESRAPPQRGPQRSLCLLLAGARLSLARLQPPKSYTEPLFAKQRTSENLYLLSKFRLRKQHRNQRKVVCILRVWVVCPGIPSVLQEQYAASSSRAPTPSKIHSAASRSGYKPVVEVLFLRSE